MNEGIPGARSHREDDLNEACGRYIIADEYHK